MNKQRSPNSSTGTRERHPPLSLEDIKLCKTLQGYCICPTECKTSGWIRAISCKYFSETHPIYGFNYFNRPRTDFTLTT